MSANIIGFPPRIAKHHDIWRWISSRAVAAHFRRRYSYIARDIGQLLQDFPTTDHVCFRLNGDAYQISPTAFTCLVAP